MDDLRRCIVDLISTPHRVGFATVRMSGNHRMKHVRMMRTEGPQRAHPIFDRRGHVPQRGDRRRLAGLLQGTCVGKGGNPQ
jgi:hypothetical protein